MITPHISQHHMLYFFIYFFPPSQVYSLIRLKAYLQAHKKCCMLCPPVERPSAGSDTRSPLITWDLNSVTPVVAFPSSLTCQPLTACCPVVKQTKVDSLLPLLLLEPTSQIAGAAKAEIRRWIVFTQLWWGLSSYFCFYVLLCDIFSSDEGVLCQFAALKSCLICFTRKQDVIACICICMEVVFSF